VLTQIPPKRNCVSTNHFWDSSALHRAWLTSRNLRGQQLWSTVPVCTCWSTSWTWQGNSWL